jgi:hypothetical protein
MIALSKISFEVFALLECYVVLIGSYRRFGNLIGPVLKCQAVQEEITLRNIPEERTAHLHRGRILK